MQSLQATLAIQADDAIGEGPVWDADGSRLLWLDHGGDAVHEARADSEGAWRETRRWNLGGKVSAIIPRTRGGLLIASDHQLFFLDDAGRRTPFVSFDFDTPLHRLNDVKCDKRGRIWVGTFILDFTPRAVLYRVDLDGTVHTMVEHMILPNGLDWSPDGATFYLIDSIGGTVEAFDFDQERGTLANRRTLLVIKPPDGLPNGMTVDSEGCLWVALTTGGEVRRYAPDGSLLARVSVPISGVTSCGFGGADGRDLFITTRRGRVPEVVKTIGVTEEQMESTGPAAGALFVCRPGARGVAPTPFPG
jgi:sugar lactone lactonase YvrE